MKRRRNRDLQRQNPQQQGTLTQVRHQQQLRIAPLPTAEELAKYDQVLPGLAERIVSMAEHNGDDRRRSNRTIRWATIMGQVFAFVVAMTALVGGFSLVNSGQDAAGIATIITAIGVPLGAYVFSRVRQQPR